MLERRGGARVLLPHRQQQGWRERCCVARAPFLTTLATVAHSAFSCVGLATVSRLNLSSVWNGCRRNVSRIRPSAIFFNPSMVSSRGYTNNARLNPSADLMAPPISWPRQSHSLPTKLLAVFPIPPKCSCSMVTPPLRATLSTSTSR